MDQNPRAWREQVEEELAKKNRWRIGLPEITIGLLLLAALLVVLVLLFGF